VSKEIETRSELPGRVGTKGMDPKQFIDESLVREVEASGFIKQLYEK
jgi:hypothetical protein